MDPFDPQRRRTTTFATVHVPGLPENPDPRPVRRYYLHPYLDARDPFGNGTANVAEVLAGDLSAFYPQEGLTR